MTPTVKSGITSANFAMTDWQSFDVHFGVKSGGQTTCRSPADDRKPQKPDMIALRRASCRARSRFSVTEEYGHA